MSNPTFYSMNGLVAIEQPKFDKIEPDNRNGFAFNGNRTVLTTSRVVLHSIPLQLSPGDQVILSGDAGAQAWARKIYVLGNEQFVLCPESALIGIVRNE